LSLRINLPASPFFPHAMEAETEAAVFPEEQTSSSKKNGKNSKKKGAVDKHSTKTRVSLELESATLETGEFSTTNDKMMLHFNCWRPRATTQSNSDSVVSDKGSKAVLVLVHGLGDHGGHMMTIVEHFTKNLGITCYAYDQRGHGDSPGQRGHVGKFQQLRDDLHSFVEFVRSKEGNTNGDNSNSNSNTTNESNSDSKKATSIILFGNSMGGACVLRYAMTGADVKGVVVNAPALSLQDLNAVTTLVIKILAKFAPTMNNDAALDSTKLTRDKEKQDENTNDLLVHTSVSNQLLRELAANGDWIRANPEKLQCPALLLQGKGDRIVHPKINIEFFTKVEKTNKNASFFATEGGQHETFNDTDRKEVLAKFEEFVKTLTV